MYGLQSDSENKKIIDQNNKKKFCYIEIEERDEKSNYCNQAKGKPTSQLKTTKKSHWLACVPQSLLVVLCAALVCLAAFFSFYFYYYYFATAFNYLPIVKKRRRFFVRRNVIWTQKHSATIQKEFSSVLCEFKSLFSFKKNPATTTNTNSFFFFFYMIFVFFFFSFYC